MPDDGEVMQHSLDDPECFVQIFDRHGAAIHAYLVRRAGSQVAEDLSADLWLRAFHARHSFESSSADARPWLYGIARNVLRGHWRTQRGSGVPIEPAHDPWSDVDACLDASREVQVLRSALSKLSESEREVLLLVAWEGLTPAEIAVTLSIPAGTVRWRLHHARRLLQGHPGSCVDQLGVGSKGV